MFRTIRAWCAPLLLLFLCAQAFSGASWHSQSSQPRSRREEHTPLAPLPGVQRRHAPPLLPCQDRSRRVLGHTGTGKKLKSSPCTQAFCGTCCGHVLPWRVTCRKQHGRHRGQVVARMVPNAFAFWHGPSSISPPPSSLLPSVLSAPAMLGLVKSPHAKATHRTFPERSIDFRTSMCAFMPPPRVHSCRAFRGTRCPSFLRLWLPPLSLLSRGVVRT